MKKIVLFLIVSCNLQAQVMWQLKSDTVYKWFYKDGDEFNATDLDNNKWQCGMPWSNFAIPQDLVFANENVSLKDGCLHLMASNEARSFPIRANKNDSLAAIKNGKPIDNNTYKAQYTAGLITSRARYKYGYFEIRFKSNDEKGIWPAFWLYGGSPNEEIDFFELKGERGDQMHLDVHCPKGCDDFRGGFLNLEKNWGGWVQLKESLANDWNIVSGEWQPGYVKFFLNGEPIAYFKGDFQTAQNLFINTSVARNGEAFNPGPDEKTKWPNTFLVDYVRIWSKEDTIKTKADDSYFNKTSQTIVDNKLVATKLKKKLKFIYNEENLKSEKGVLSLLPLSSNKYSVSILGKDLGIIKIEVIDQEGTIRLMNTLINAGYTILDLNAFPTGSYKIKINIGTHTLTHIVSVIN
ncbi:MAG: glycoside hydrolase family 16 protein [Bacteroidota bacterium]